MCVCIALCTIAAHNIAQNRPDNFPSYTPDDHHCSDDDYLREGGSLLPTDYGSSCFYPTFFQLLFNIFFLMGILRVARCIWEQLQWFLTGQMTFLMPNQQCQSTQTNTTIVRRTRHPFNGLCSRTT